MARVAVLLTIFAALAGWAGAQGPAPALPPGDRVALFRANRLLLDNLVDNGVTLAEAGDTLRRAEGCRKTVRTLANSLGRAAKEDRNPDRVAELADLVGEVVRDGLAPTLAAAVETIPPESPDAAWLRELRKTAADDLDGVGADARLYPAVGDHPKVQESLARLAELRERIK